MRIPPKLESKVMDPEDVFKKILKNKKSIAFGGMGGQSVPKIIPLIFKEHPQYFKGIQVYSGGGMTKSFDDAMRNIEISRRFYYLSDKKSRDDVNNGKTMMMDYSVYKYSKLLSLNSMDKIDVAVLEATEVNSKGIILSLSVDATPALCNASKKIIIEINRSKPVLTGLHDITDINSVREHQFKKIISRIGKRELRINQNKIAAIIYSDGSEESAASYGKPPEEINSIAENIWCMLDEKIKFKNTMPVQVGAGSIASSLIDKSPFNDLKIWCEIAPARWTEYIGHKIKYISASAIYTLQGDEVYTKKFMENYLDYSGNIVLRPNYITNSPEIISGLGVIVLQQAIEIDIFGSANVSHIRENIYNGVGGSIDFCSSGKYVAIVMPSTAMNGKISRIVPMLSCVDIPRMLVDFVVTEIGIADLRWKDPRERAVEIIKNCVHPNFKDSLLRYMNYLNAGHLPYNINEIIKWNKN